MHTLVIQEQVSLTIMLTKNSRGSRWRHKIPMWACAGNGHNNFDTVAETCKYYGCSSNMIEKRKPSSHLFTLLKKVWQP